ncbi:sensor domain-containing diguanylate cyclase [Acholeplasma granularum]|uniref:sensor domain-containing diguanylate cyclase n=1 Tax=Acholeplasma granularum TaxID=264635 RepID=UPI00046E6525|nr:diguanylate cyclase [Acholeplasma granularum]
MIAYTQHPIFGLILSFFIIIFVITQSILRENILKNRLTFSFINLALFIVAMFIYDSHIIINENYLLVYIIYLYFNYFIFLISLYNTFRNAITNASQYQLFIKGVKNTKWNVYYVVDHKERIKDISVSLLRELNLDKSDVIGKKLFQVFNSKVRFTHMNGEEINNRTLEKYYNDYKKIVRPNDSEDIELHLLNYNGESIVLHLNTQPLFTIGKYRGRMAVGEKKTDETLMEVERELKKTDYELESIRHKFIATIELSEDGLFYINLDDKDIWINDVLKNQLKLPTNTLDVNEYRTLIEPNDLKKYLQIISDLTPNKPSYSVSYRLHTDNQIIWIKEKGKRLFEDKQSAVIMGIMTPIHSQHFRKTGIEVLDSLKDENYILPDLKALIQSGRPFQLAIINLKNIPKINETHGREIGNMIMGQYIATLKQTFITESSDIYRLSGLEFVITITDQRKMASLYKGIKAEENHLNMTVDYGSITAELEVFIGIATMYDDAVNAQDLYQNAYQALKTAQLPQYKGQGCYFKDIK